MNDLFECAYCNKKFSLKEKFDLHQIAFHSPNNKPMGEETDDECKERLVKEELREWSESDE